MPEEILDIVDKNDIIIGKNTRKESYENCTTNRVSDIFLKNSEGKIALQKRSNNCNFMPGAWTTSAGGHVSSGQTYLESAYRELEEEIGVHCMLRKIDKYIGERKAESIKYYNNSQLENQKEHYFFCTVYEGIYDGKFIFRDGEADDVQWFSLGELRKMIDDGEKMTPTTVHILENYYLN